MVEVEHEACRTWMPGVSGFNSHPANRGCYSHRLYGRGHALGAPTVVLRKENSWSDRWNNSSPLVGARDVVICGSGVRRC